MAETISSSATAATLYFTNWEREMVRLMRAAAADRAGNEGPQNFTITEKAPTYRASILGVMIVEIDYYCFHF